MAWTTQSVSTPGFVADHASVDRNTGRQIDWAGVSNAYLAGTQYTITAAATEPIGETSIAVVALPVALPTGTVLDFEGSEAVLTAAAAAGATTITAAPLVAAITSGDVATYTVSGSGGKAIPAGTIMSEQEDGTLIPRAVGGSATCILETAAEENSRTDSLSGYGCIVGGVIYTDLLPDAGNAAIATWQGELNAAGVGHFVWETYADSREPTP